MPIVIQQNPVITLERMESDVVDTCNLRCKNCAHFSPLYKKNSYTFEEFKDDVYQLATAMHVGLFDLLGGEPMLLGSRIADYVQVLRESGLCDKVGMITNGILLPRFEHVIPLFDRIHLSLYHHKDYDRINSWAEERKYPNVGVVERGEFIKLFDPENLRLTEAEAEETFRECGGKKTCNEIYRGRFYRCAQAFKMWPMLRSEGIQCAEPTEIGIDLYNPDLEERLGAYLASETKEDACFYCRLNGSVAKWEKWEEI